MKKKETIELIKGTFMPVEAREIVLQLLESKIKFHRLKSWSSRERFGKPDADSEQRLIELSESRKRVESAISKSINEEKNITISSTIEMSIE